MSVYYTASETAIDDQSDTATQQTTTNHHERQQHTPLPYTKPTLELKEPPRHPWQKQTMAAHQDAENETTNRNRCLSKPTGNQIGAERLHLLHTLRPLRMVKGPSVQPKKPTSSTAKPDPYCVKTPPPSETTTDPDLLASRDEYEQFSGAEPTTRRQEQHGVKEAKERRDHRERGEAPAPERAHTRRPDAGPELCCV
ncbi:hypothetical protein F2Q68_00038543 [Brassica cretica]|uniref:Uncharacterized protein n=1 Tax=Brassica cretica TaxID=69181 RepID=A0A8S9MIU0_BRACR|nr:hypothetical protein F2Q68_00038543 [Brassica cretica]